MATDAEARAVAGEVSGLELSATVAPAIELLGSRIHVLVDTSTMHSAERACARSHEQPLVIGPVVVRNPAGIRLPEGMLALADAGAITPCRLPARFTSLIEVVLGGIDIDVAAAANEVSIIAVVTITLSNSVRNSILLIRKAPIWGRRRRAIGWARR